MKNEIKQPTLKEAIARLHRDGGYLKGEANGRVIYCSEDEVFIKLDKKEESAQDILDAC